MFSHCRSIIEMEARTKAFNTLVRLIKCHFLGMEKWKKVSNSEESEEQNGETMTIEKLVTVKRSQRARRVALRLDARERIVNLVIPPRMTLDNAFRFAEKHQDWVREVLAALPPSIPFEHGMILPIFGEKKRISIRYDKNNLGTQIELLKTVLQVTTNQKDPSARIQRFLRSHAKKKLTELAREKAKKIKKPLNAVAVRDTKSRWGSCSEDGNISFSWRLIFAPYVAMDYVVAHEVAHLVHMDHSDAFWNVCRKLSDDFLDGQYWMRNHGNELMRFGQ